MHYLYLTLAIVLEVLATALLGKSEGFTKWLFAVGSLLSYGVCFYFLSLALKNIPLGVAYAIWSGVGIVLTAIVSVLVFKSKIDLPFVLGTLLIIAGVVVINLFSKTSGHWFLPYLLLFLLVIKINTTHITSPASAGLATDQPLAPLLTTLHNSFKSAANTTV